LGYSLESTGDNTYWNGMKFIDLGQRMEEVMPGLYELVITRTDLINRTQAYFHTCPHLEVFRTADLFAPIKGSDGWWTFRGRTDNWITMSNGLKMDPTDMENAISAHPDVMGVLVAGSHRFRLCLLIELRPESAPKSDEEREEILGELWPTIDEANKAAPKFGRVPKELITFTSPDKPFRRAGKGTIQRRLSIAAYDDEIEDLYAKAEEGLLTSGLPPLKSRNIDDLLPFLRGIYAESLDNYEIGVDDDLFLNGLDSLSMFLIAARIKAGLRKHNVSEKLLGKVDNTLLSTSATIRRLAQKLSHILSELNGITKLTNGSSNVKELQALLAKYEAQIPTILQDGRKRGQTIVLTGSAGSLGSYILSALLAREDVKKVYCLNRSSDAQEKQISSFKSKGLPVCRLERVRFLQAKIAEQNLGLTEDEYASLTLESTTIIHNAYPVNFLMPVESFEPQIQGLLHLLQLAQDSIRDPAFLFISSIAAAVPAAGPRSIVKEAVLDIDEAGSLLQQGYGQSKFICEKLVEKYASSSSSSPGGGGGGGKGAILRVGQIAGPLRGPGVWNVWEWAPSMLLSSKYLGAVPESVGTAPVDWIPVDALGQIVSELVDDVGQRESGAVAVYNISNPTTTPWKELLGAVREAIPETVPAAEWIAKLEKSQVAGAHTLGRNPGLKLIDFYKQAFLGGGSGSGGKQSIVVEKHNLLWGSKTARELSPVKPEHLARWMRGWGL
jgi:thioester reductase-like protein